MKIKTVTLLLFICVLFSRSRQTMHLKRKKIYPLNIYLRNAKTLIKRNRRNGESLFILKNPKIKIILFLLSKNNNPFTRNRRKIPMTVFVENDEQQKRYDSGKNEYNFTDISNSLNYIYWKDRTYNNPPPLIQIAPMINVTNRHFRALMRMLTNRAQLWTEMVVDNTLLYNLDTLEQYLGYDEKEHPIVCQLGGSDCTRMTEAAMLVEQYGYDEININVGCPSNKVANRGSFGAYLMKEPEHVRNLVYEIKKKVQIPVSVKIRTGVDDLDSFEFLQKFIQLVSTAGCNNFVVHARKAWLKGLDPKKNRKIPPLEYKKVFDLCQIYPNLKFTLNGGIQTIEEAVALLNGYMPLSHMYTQTNSDTNYYDRHNGVNLLKKNKKEKTGTDATDNKKKAKIQDEKNEEKMKVSSNRTYVKIKNYDINPLNGVMIGRAAMENTVILSQVDKIVYNEEIPLTAHSRRSILEAYVNYLEKSSNNNTVVSAFELLKPILGILKGMPGHRIFRNKLDNYIRLYATTLPCSEILEKVIHEVNISVPGVLDLPLSNQKLQQEYIDNYKSHNQL